ncbi:electron transfer flavoprotein beta subunit lysine methyltransferase [Cricetulus griseus]
MAFRLGWKTSRSHWSFLQAVSSGFPLISWRTAGSCLDPEMKAYLEENTEVTSSGSLTPEIQLRLLTPRCKFWWERAELWPYSDPYWAIYWPGGQALSRYVSLKCESLRLMAIEESFSQHPPPPPFPSFWSLSITAKQGSHWGSHVPTCIWYGLLSFS